MNLPRREARGPAGPVVERVEVVVRLPRALAARIERVYPNVRVDAVLLAALGEHLDEAERRPRG